jgi:hypothetical protein
MSRCQPHLSQDRHSPIFKNKKIAVIVTMMLNFRYFLEPGLIIKPKIYGRTWITEILVNGSLLYKGLSRKIKCTPYKFQWINGISEPLNGIPEKSTKAPNLVKTGFFRTTCAAQKKKKKKKRLHHSSHIRLIRRSYEFQWMTNGIMGGEGTRSPKS